MMRISKIVAGFIAVLSVAAALENFGTIGFTWKLIAVIVSAIIVLLLLADWLSNWVKINIQAGFSKRIPSRSWIRYGVSVASITTTLVCFGIFAWAIVNYYTIGVVEIAPSNGKYQFWIQAAVPLANKVNVRLPPQTQIKCNPIDPPGSGTNRADAMMIDWDSSNPQLQLSNFSYPQQIGLKCGSLIDLNKITVRVEPPTTPVFLPAHRSRYKKSIFILGGILWIAGLLTFLFWSRSR